MIVTVTDNPSIDKTAELNKLEPGALNRLQNVLSDAGGKGVNVSKTLAMSLGYSSLATGFVGANAEQFLGTLAPFDFTLDFIALPNSTTRTNLKIIDADGALTELNEPGIEASDVDLESLAQKLESLASADTLFALSGSLPQRCPLDYYAALTERLHRRGARVFVDADGPALALALEQTPDFIKPNRYELLKYFGADERSTERDLIAMCRELRRRGVSLVALSMGADGAMFFSESGDFKARAVDVAVQSTVGAGDAMVAALCFGIERALPMKQTFRLAMAVSAGAASTPGTKPPSKQLVDELLPRASLVALD